jgi:chromate transport protein ChrA
MNRFAIALAAYVVIASVAWFTLSDQKIRLVTLVLIGAFALRTFTLHARRKSEEQSEIR